MKKTGKRIILVLISLVLFIVLGFLIFSNQEKKLTSSEKEWLTSNQNKVQNINVTNDTSIFGFNGHGIYYDFLDSFEEEYQIKLNKVTISKGETPNYLALTVGNTMPQNAFLFYEDHYVLVGKNELNITNRNKINRQKIGVLGKNETNIKKHLADLTEIEWVSYASEEELWRGLEGNEVNYVIVPRMESISEILTKKYWISYHLSDIKRTFYVNDNENSVLYQIIYKYFQTWQKELASHIYGEERMIFKEGLGISDSELSELQTKTIKYAYKQYLPYEIYNGGSYGGIIGKYITNFSEFAKLDIDYEKYTSDKKLTRDLNNNKITLLSNFYNYTNNGTSIPTNIPMYAGVYTDESVPFVLNSKQALQGKTIYVEENSVFLSKLTDLNATIKTFKLKDINKILKKKENILVLDKEVGSYLQKGALKEYELRYTFDLNATYSMKSFGSEILNKLLKRYMNYLDNPLLTQTGISEARTMDEKGSLINSLASYMLYAIIIIIVILLLIYRSSKKVRLQKKIKKEDKLKFIDHLTSLKNRNYFNDNIGAWNKNVIYPQAVIIVDLNRVQEINDTLGYEEGDKQIKAAANVLIKTQLDNTDIIRTNGNEFMIYLVGYSQKQLTSYIHKLYKEFNKELPYEYGVCISYSMILDDLKLIEDAVNECVEDIKKQKEEKKD